MAFLLLCSAPLFGQLTGRRAPSFSLPDSATLAQHDILDYRGKWLLLDFMKTDCPKCRAAAGVMKQVQAQFGGKLAELAIVISPPENQGTVNKFLKESGANFPILFDQGQVAVGYFKATPERDSFDTPHIFVIDPQGNIVKDWEEGNPAVQSAAAMSAALNQLMGVKPPAPAAPKPPAPAAPKPATK